MKPIASFDGVCGVYMDFPRVLLTLGAALSIASLGIIFALFYYYKIPNLRRHPTSKYLCVKFFNVCLLMLNEYSFHLQLSISTNVGLN